MLYSTHVVWQLTDDINHNILLEKDSHEFCGQAELACGASGEEYTVQADQQALAQEEMSDFGQRFAQESGYLNTVNNALTPIEAAGPNQQGFNASELANLETTNLNSNAAAAKNADIAVGNTLAGRGGGSSSGITSGVDQQIKAAVASTAAENTAAGQNQIEAANYATGRQNFMNATTGLESLAGLSNPSSYGETATSGFGSSFGEADKINTENNAMEADIAGMITGATSDFTTGTEGGGGLGGGLLALAGG